MKYAISIILATVLSGCGSSPSQPSALAQVAASDSSAPSETCLETNGPFYGLNLTLDSSGNINGNIITGTDEVSVAAATTYSSTDGQVIINVPQTGPASGWVNVYGTLSIPANAIPSGTCTTSASISGTLNATGNVFSGAVTFTVSGAASIVIYIQ